MDSIAEKALISLPKGFAVPRLFHRPVKGEDPSDFKVLVSNPDDLISRSHGTFTHLFAF